MARSKNDREKLIEALREAPFISQACKKLGVARATFYRWREEQEFEGEVQEALKMGRERGCDMAEMALYKSIQNENMTAIKFFLQNNDPRYALKRPIYMSPHHTLQPGETCPVCNSTASTELTEEEKTHLHKLLRKHTIPESGVKKQKNNNNDE